MKIELKIARDWVGLDLCHAFNLQIGVPRYLFISAYRFVLVRPQSDDSVNRQQQKHRLVRSWLL
jgi:hypothetical protein